MMVIAMGLQVNPILISIISVAVSTQWQGPEFKPLLCSIVFVCEYFA